MNELTRLVAEKTGLSQEMAAKAVEAVIDVLKQRLPPALGGQIDSLLGSSTGKSGFGSLMSGFSGLLGRK
jgi:hypothetical protein